MKTQFDVAFGFGSEPMNRGVLWYLTVTSEEYYQIRVGVMDQATHDVWPDEVRDKVVARRLDLNDKRVPEEGHR